MPDSYRMAVAYFDSCFRAARPASSTSGAAAAAARSCCFALLAKHWRLFVARKRSKIPQPDGAEAGNRCWRAPICISASAFASSSPFRLLEVRPIGVVAVRRTVSLHTLARCENVSCLSISEASIEFGRRCGVRLFALARQLYSSTFCDKPNFEQCVRG